MATMPKSSLPEPPKIYLRDIVKVVSDDLQQALAMKDGQMFDHLVCSRDELERLLKILRQFRMLPR